MPNDNKELITTSADTSSKARQQSGKTKASPKTPSKVQKLDSPVKLEASGTPIELAALDSPVKFAALDSPIKLDGLDSSSEAQSVPMNA